MRKMSILSGVMLALLMSGLAYGQSADGCPKVQGEAHMFLYPTGSVPAGVQPSACKSPTCSPYIVQDSNDWLLDSWYQVDNSSLSLTIANEATQHAQTGTLLVIAVSAAKADSLLAVTLSGGDGGLVTIPRSAFDSDPDLPYLTGNGQAGSHGVYLPSGDALYAFYVIGAIAQSGGGAAFGTRTISVQASTTGDPDLIVHFDAYDCETGDFAANSSDLNWIGPGQCLTITCPQAQTAECLDDGSLLTFNAPSVINSCGDPVVISGPLGETSFPYDCHPTTSTVTFTATAGTTSVSCNTTVTVLDRTAPTLACVDQTVYADAQCAAGAQGASAADACDGAVTVQCDQTQFSGTGVYAMTCSAGDCAANSATCTATVTVLDNVDPAIVCPASQTLECLGPCATPATVIATAGDNCSPVVPTCDPGTGNYCLGSTTNTCSATDASGNGASCTQAVTVQDTLDPAISCAAPQVFATSQIDANLCAASMPVSAGALDLCEGALTAACGQSLLALNLPGTLSTTCTVADSSDNEASCETFLTLIDDTAPAITCIADQTVVADADCMADAAISASAQDNCYGALATTCVPSELLFTLPGTADATCVASDGSGNSAACTTRVTMVDLTPPAITCPAPIVVYADDLCLADAAVAATAADNCDSAVTAVCDPAAVHFMAPASSPAICGAEDEYGNAASCATTVTMIDPIAPVVTLGPIDGYPGDDGFCNDTPIVIPFAVSENCACDAFVVTASQGVVAYDSVSHSGTVTVDLTNVRGNLTVTITVTDCSGNSGSAAIATVSETCFCTYTQGGWGAVCKGGNPGCLLKAGFAMVYPAGLTIGDQGSPFNARFTSSSAVEKYLPAGETPGMLTANLVNPLTTPAGVFGGQVTAAQLSVDFDDADLLASIDALPLGDLVVGSGPFVGQTVRDLLQLAQQVLGGNLSLLPAGTTVSDLNQALDAINRNFDGCKASLGFLLRP